MGASARAGGEEHRHDEQPERPGRGGVGEEAWVVRGDVVAREGAACLGGSSVESLAGGQGLRGPDAVSRVPHLVFEIESQAQRACRRITHRARIKIDRVETFLKVESSFRSDRAGGKLIWGSAGMLRTSILKRERKRTGRALGNAVFTSLA